MSKRHLVLSTACVLPLSSIIVASQPAAAPAPKVRTTTEIPYLSDATVAALQSLATDGEGGSSRFLGLSDFADDSQKLHVISNRTLIAWNTAKAAESGGRFRPSRDQRADVVIVNCGDEDIGEQFECSSVRVTVNGRAVTPASYRSGSNTYRNAFGAVWKVREVTGAYPARALANGFSVDYASPGGGEWTLDVSPEQAGAALLLSFDAKRYAAELAEKEKAWAAEKERFQRQLDAAALDLAESRAESERIEASRPEAEILRLSSTSTFDRLSAAQWFADSPTPAPIKAIPALIKALGDSEWGVQIAAARALERMGPSAATEACPGLAAALKTAASNIVPQIRSAHRAICGE